MPRIVTPSVLAPRVVTPRTSTPDDGRSEDAPPPPTYELHLETADFDERPEAFAAGVGGSNYRAKFVTVGTAAYIYFLHTAGTPSGNVATGYDPGDFPAEFPELDGMTGYPVTLPAGRSTPEEVADLVAPVAATIPGVNSAAAALAARSDGAWTCNITTNHVVAWGARAWDDRGAAGVQGSEIIRRPMPGVEDGGFLSQLAPTVRITRPIASRKTPLPANAIVWAAQMQLGTNVSTTNANRPRLQYWWSSSDTSPAGSETFDFGQLPTAQVVAGGTGTIYMTPAQCLAFYEAHAAASGDREWISFHAVDGTDYVGAPVGSGYEGSHIDQGIRVENVASNSPESAIATWSAAGEANFAFLNSARVVYEVDPCTTLEHQTPWGSFAPYAAADPGHPDDVGWVDFVTGLAIMPTSLIGRRLLSMSVGIVSISAGTARFSIHEGGTIDADAPNMVGSTRLVDLGTTSTTGGLATIAGPTGASTVRMPAAGCFAVFKGNGVTGRGDSGPGPFATCGDIDQPASQIRRFGANLGLCMAEVDVTRTAPGYGDSTVASESPITDPDTTHRNVGNNPNIVLMWGHPAIPVTVAA